MDRKLSYAGIAGAVAGIVGLFGILGTWWETNAATYKGTADKSGSLALAMAIGLFVFGGAYILMSDAGIRRAMSALMTLCAVLLTLSCIWGLTRADTVAAGAKVGTGMWVSLLGGLLGIAGGLMAMRDNAAADAAGSKGTSAPSGSADES